jgi:hypothetical protein
MRPITRIRYAWAAALALGAAGPASAFYWDGWPGSGVPAPRSIAPTPGGSPKFPPNPTAEPKFPPGGEPPGSPPGGPPKEAPEPETVPEPATALAVLTGLGVLAARRARRK